MNDLLFKGMCLMILALGLSECLVKTVATKQTRAYVDCICDNKTSTERWNSIKSIGSGKALGALKLCST